MDQSVVLGEILHGPRIATGFTGAASGIQAVTAIFALAFIGCVVDARLGRDLRAGNAWPNGGSGLRVA